MSCKNCKSYLLGEYLCADGHNQIAYLESIPHCLRDDFSNRSFWPWWLDESGKPKQKETVQKLHDHFRGLK